MLLEPQAPVLLAQACFPPSLPVLVCWPGGKGQLCARGQFLQFYGPLFWGAFFVAYFLIFDTEGGGQPCDKGQLKGQLDDKTKHGFIPQFDFLEVILKKKSLRLIFSGCYPHSSM